MGLAREGEIFQNRISLKINKLQESPFRVGAQKKEAPNREQSQYVVENTYRKNVYF
jgi:hypothetical protein